MGMELAITEEEGVLVVAVSGRFELADANRALVELFEAVARHGTKKVLVDCRPLAGSITILELDEHTTFGARELRRFASQGVDLGTRFAYVTVGPFFDPTRFAETVAVNRGMVLRLYNDVDAARSWLDTPVPDAVVEGG
jgi:hypothetical protein